MVLGVKETIWHRADLYLKDPLFKVSHNMIINLSSDMGKGTMISGHGPLMIYLEIVSIFDIFWGNVEVRSTYTY